MAINTMPEKCIHGRISGCYDCRCPICDKLKAGRLAVSLWWASKDSPTDGLFCFTDPPRVMCRPVDWRFRFIDAETCWQKEQEARHLAVNRAMAAESRCELLEKERDEAYFTRDNYQRQSEQNWLKREEQWHRAEMAEERLRIQVQTSARLASERSCEAIRADKAEWRAEAAETRVGEMTIALDQVQRLNDELENIVASMRKGSDEYLVSRMYSKNATLRACVDDADILIFGFHKTIEALVETGFKAIIERDHLREAQEAEWKKLRLDDCWWVPIEYGDQASSDLMHVQELRSDYEVLKVEFQRARQDVLDAAGELVLPIPEPGTDMAKVMVANGVLKTQLRRWEEAFRKYREALDAWRDEL